MSNRRTATDLPRNEAGLVDQFIGTAYDTVKGVYDNLEVIQEVYDAIETIDTLASDAVEAAMVPARAEMQTAIGESQAAAAESLTHAQEAAASAADAAQSVVDIDNAMTAKLALPGASAGIGFQQNGVGAVPITVETVLRTFITNEMFAIPLGSTVSSGAELEAAEAEAYASGRQLMLNGTYLLDRDITFRRGFTTIGTVKFMALAAGDTVPTKNLYFERKFSVEGVIFEYLNVNVATKDGGDQLVMMSSMRRNHFINAPLKIGQIDLGTHGMDVSDNEFVWRLSRNANAITVQNTSLVNVERNKFQSFLNAWVVQPTVSFAANGLTFRDNELANCTGGIRLTGSSMNRISKTIIENNIISGSTRDASSISSGAIVAVWCIGLDIIRNTMSHNSDLIKIQGCIGVNIMYNDAASNIAVFLRSSGCCSVRVIGNKMMGTGYLILVGAANVNPIITNNPYPSKDIYIHDNDLLSDTLGIKFIDTENADVRRNRLTARLATGVNGLLWFATNMKNSRHYDNLYYAPSGLSVKNDSGAEVTSAVAATTLITKATPTKTVSAPVITEIDASLNNTKSYIVEFTIDHYTLIRQLANDTTPKALSAWMTGVAGATLAWNSAPWNVPTGKIGDIIVNGIAYDNYDTEDWWWAQSMMVIDRHNRLTCRNWATSTSSQNVPPGVSARQLAEDAWQTAAFRPPLVVDGLLYDPVPSGLVTEPGYSTQPSARTALGQKADGTYVLLVADGQSGVRGPTLPQLAAKMLALGCINAYNLDGGGSSTLWYNGVIINAPSDPGGERAVPAVMYI